MTYNEQTSACSTSMTPSFGTVQPMPCPCPPPPADQLRFTAYKKVVGTYDEAVNIAINKKLVLGEPCVIPFMNGDDVELLFAIGSMTDMPFVKDSASMDNLDNAWINDPTTGEKILIVDWIRRMKSDILGIINQMKGTIANNKKAVDASIKALDSSLAYQTKRLETKIDNNISSLQKQITKIDSSVHNMPNILASNENFLNALVNAMYSNETYRNNLEAAIDDRLTEFASNYQYKTFYGTLYD